MAAKSAKSLQSKLEENLKRNLAGVGSPLYRQAWEEKTTPGGRRYLALTASAVKGTRQGWATPMAGNACESGATDRQQAGWDTLPRQAHRTVAKLDATKRLNPELAIWLMGFPRGWSDYAPTVTRRKE
jgi:hypothetical protein